MYRPLGPAERIGVVVLAVGFVGGASLRAQDSLNGGFERRSAANPELPRGWTALGSGRRVSLDGTTTAQGRLSLRIRAADPPLVDSGVGVARQIDGDIARGRRLVFRARVYAPSAAAAGGAHLWARVAGPGGRPIGYARSAGQAAALDGTAWRQATLDLEVDPRAEYVIIALAGGAGGAAAWFDDAAVTLDGVPYDSLLRDGPPSREEVAALWRHAVAFRTSDPEAHFDDLGPVRAMVGEARVVALGEATHGTHEFFEMKDRLVRYMVTELGVTAFAIEAGMPEARALNDYVLTGRGDPAKLVERLGYWVWNTDELVALVEWLRAYNAAGRGRVEVWGFDMQTPAAAADSVVAYVRQEEPDLLPTVERAYGRIRSTEARQAAGAGSLDSAGAAEWASAARAVLGVLEQRLTSGRAGQSRDSARVEWTLRYAQLVLQAGAQLLVTATSDASVRDSCMAENVRWLLARQPRGGRVVLWAHNVHVSREDGAMGGYLRGALGEGVRTVGMATYEGSYVAAEAPGLRPYPAFPAPPGSIEHALHQTASARLFLDVRAASADPRLPWLRRPHQFRSVGALALDPGFNRITLTDAFDVVVFFDRTTPAASRAAGYGATSAAGGGTAARLGGLGALLAVILVGALHAPKKRAPRGAGSRGGAARREVGDARRQRTRDLSQSDPDDAH